MWVPPEFRKFLYEKKAEDPNKTLGQIMKEIARKEKKKNESFWAKI